MIHRRLKIIFGPKFAYLMATLSLTISSQQHRYTGFNACSGVFIVSNFFCCAKANHQTRLLLAADDDQMIKLQKLQRTPQLVVLEMIVEP